jgi:hypothetical protein
MASGTINAFGYKAGDTVSIYIRSVGRIVNAGNAIYTFAMVDRPVLASSCSVSISAVNVYRCSAQTEASYNTSGSISVIGIKGNIIVIQVPINQTVSAGSTYFLECNGSITFS